MNRGGDALPADAFPVPVSRAAEFQQLLNQHGRIRLEPAGDYRRATGITLRSGQGVFGVAGTRMGRLTIAPGTTGAVVSGVVPEMLEFPPSALATRDNCFERFAARGSPQAPLVLRNVVVTNNLFLDTGQLVIDTSAGGRVSNNRFIRTAVHGAAPALQIRGRDAATGDRNTFLWTNVLSAAGDGIVIKGQAQADFIGLDAEDWNYSGQADQPAMFTASETGIVRVFMAQGGVSGATSIPYMDIASSRFELAGLRLYRSAEPAIRLHAGTRHFNSVLASDSRVRIDSPDSASWIAFPDGADRVVARTVAGSAKNSPPARTWEPPLFDAIADPAGSDWRRQRAAAPDSTARIQGLIDTRGIAVLPAGVFHVSASLRLKSGQGIVGAGATRTVIVAKSDDIDIIVGDDHLSRPRPISMVLADITLQGGRTGIRHDVHGSGAAQYVYNHISHVVFRNMSEAGIAIDGIYGWDNNLLDEVTFYRMPVGLRQKPSAAYISAEASGNASDANYLDKIVCYRCRFQDVDTGLALIAVRANNLNACVNCSFIRNRQGAIRLRYNASTVIANSDFIDNGGDPVIASDQPVGIVASRFVASGSGSLLDADAICSGCEFSSHKEGRATLSREGARVILLDSRAVNITLGRNSSGLLVNSVVPEVRSASLVRLANGKQTVLQQVDPASLPPLLADWTD